MGYDLPIVAGIGFVFMVYVVGRLQKADREIALLRDKLDHLYAKAGARYDPASDLPADVLSAIRAGNKIKAIKLYRAATSASLLESKTAIDRLMG